MPTDPWLNAIFSLVPSIVIGLAFWVVVRAIVRADRREREVQAKIEAQERAKVGLPVE